MRRTDFFDNNVTRTLTTADQTVDWYPGQFLNITVFYNGQPLATTSDRVTVQVQKVYSTSYVDVTPVRRVDPPEYFPTRWELQRLAAIAGGMALRSKHNRTPKKALVLRSSFQGMARLPCYRGVRPR